MTPRHFAAVWKCYIDQEERAERRVGAQMLQIANLMRDTKEHPQPYTLEDIMGHNGSVPRSQGPRSTAVEIDTMRMMFEAIRQRNEAMEHQGFEELVAQGYVAPKVRADG